MNFISESYSFASKDGRVVLRACIDRPLNSSFDAFDYLNRYSASILEYVNDKLLWKALEAHDKSDRESIRFVPLLYTFKCSVTYSDDTYLSCVMIAKLSQVTNMISQSLDSVVFVKNQILPPGLFYNAHKNSKLVIDEEGFPCVATLEDGKLALRRVGKNSILK